MSSILRRKVESAQSESLFCALVGARASACSRTLSSEGAYVDSRKHYEDPNYVKVCLFSQAEGDGNSLLDFLESS